MGRGSTKRDEGKARLPPVRLGDLTASIQRFIAFSDKAFQLVRGLLLKLPRGDHSITRAGGAAVAEALPVGNQTGGVDRLFGGRCLTKPLGRFAGNVEQGRTTEVNGRGRGVASSASPNGGKIFLGVSIPQAVVGSVVGLLVLRGGERDCQRCLALAAGHGRPGTAGPRAWRTFPQREREVLQASARITVYHSPPACSPGSAPATGWPAVMMDRPGTSK